jgi:hypothetical protein
MMQKLKGSLLAIELNPIVVKELRQAVRSWAIIGALIMLTVVLFITVMSMVGLSGVSVDLSRPVGRNVLEVIVTILNVVGIIFIPGYVGARVTIERQAENLDLFYISTLSPARIIRGKMLSGAYIALLFYSICLPFMFFTNLLRGVDLPTIATAVGFSFFLVLVSIQVAIFIAAIPLNRAFKTLIALALMFFVVPMVASFIFSSFRMFRSGLGSSIGSWAFWSDILPGGLVVIAAVGLLHLLSIAMVTPPTANRALPIRVYVACVWLVSGIAAFIAQSTGSSRIFNVWMVCFVILGNLAFLVAACEPDRYSLRVRRDVPRSVLGRRFAFLFFSGAGGAFFWAAAGVLLTILFTRLVENGVLGAAVRPHIRIDEQDWAQIVAVTLYMLAYSLFGVALRRWFFPRQPAILGAVIAIILPTLWVFIPMLFTFFFNNFAVDVLERFHPGNPINVFMPRMTPYAILHLAYAAAMVIVGVLFNFTWLIRSMKEFKPLESAEENARVG